MYSNSTPLQQCLRLPLVLRFTASNLRRRRVFGQLLRSLGTERTKPRTLQMLHACYSKLLPCGNAGASAQLWRIFAVSMKLWDYQGQL